MCICFKAEEFKLIIVDALHDYEERVLHRSHSGVGLDSESPIVNIMRTARRMSIAHHAVLSVEKHYAKMSLDELVKDLVLLEGEVSRHNLQLRDMEGKFSKMTKAYEQVRNSWIWERYKVLKLCIEEVTQDCLVDF